MTSRISLNLATIRPADLERKLHAAATAGFRAVGLLWDEMAAQREAGLEEVRLSGLAVSEIASIGGWTDSDRATRLVAMARVEQACELAASVRCDLVVAQSPAGEVEPFAAANDFREICRLAEPFRVKVGLEFIGSHRQISTVAAAWEIIDLADAENGGLVIDTFHYFRGGSTLEMLEPVPGGKVFLVQVSDCMELPRHEMENRHRVYPGTGVFPLEPLLGALREKGYSGYYSLELHNEEYWQESPLVVAREGLRAMRRLDLR
jgi:sugar phosphate isomerase/epimerase